MSPLLDILALATFDLAVGNPRRAALVAPLPVAGGDADNGRLGSGYLLRVAAVDGNEVTRKVMLAAEGPST